MSNNDIYNDNDYVYFKGNSLSNIEDERNYQIARIKEYNEQNKKFSVYLINTKRDICCNASQLQTICTKEKHLLFIGFKKMKDGAFWLNNHTILNFEILIHRIETRTISGLCLIKSSQKKEINEYISNNDFNLNIFYEDFPYVGELNDFIRFLKSQEIKFDEMELLMA